MNSGLSDPWSCLLAASGLACLDESTCFTGFMLICITLYSQTGDEEASAQTGDEEASACGLKGLGIFFSGMDSVKGPQLPE